MTFMRCKFRRSAFSAERIFHFALATDNEVAGVAPLHYCFSGSGKPLHRDEPGAQGELNGLIRVEVLDYGDGANSIVELPNNKVIKVLSSMLQTL